ncbi:MAG: T9SS type A sorting domain-containing protein [Bacteroidetes bacterium]|nr:T9SS type A sorting domain-containing protein [Bacteroidota bacterium]MBK7108314.1 T9SS type A sorting domain-containing protein [Bacteroidota bacterium]MBK8486263.1 T9SS type A sorting domain-containing protein [Bacteroidota bacterium]MBK8683046.1 T9SS type A sorting domain-containing protein [Bacteroidota bacterium]MBP9548050.1 T9SS type A sorting domain-containing protein [Chitinophagales bacterium]
MKKLFNLLLILTALVFTNTANSQGWGYATPGHWVQDVAESSDGSVFAIGLVYDITGFSYSDNYVVKLDSDGAVAWSNDGSGLSFGYFTGQNIFPSLDGGCVVYGIADFGSPAFYKLDSDGIIEWESDFAAGFGSLYYGAAVELSDGRFATVGLGEDLFYHIAEVSSDGSLLNTYSIAADTISGWGFSYYDYKETGMVATADGGFAFSCGKTDYRTIHKFDSDINLEWTQDYAHGVDKWEYGQYLNGLQTSDDGGYLLAGSALDTLVGYSGSLRKIDADGNLEWLQYYNHGAEYEEGAHVTQLDADTYMVWTQNAGDNSTHGWVLDEDGNQVDSILIPIINCTWGFGETGMEIWDVQKSADGGYILAGRQYLEDCNQRFTVIKSNADGSFPDCIFNCVWPGDANNDGLADASDLFEIGINYGADGFTRDDMSIDWSGKLSRAWMEPDTLYWYVLNDLKYTDCNGDGIINDDDTTAVADNLGLDHPLNTLRTSASDVELYFDPAFDELNVGLNQIPIMLGDAINSVDEIYGIRFTITATGESVLGESLKVVFDDSWLASSTEKLSISKTNASEKLVVSGIVRKDRNNTDGNGQIARMDVVVIDNISGGAMSDEVDFQFGDIQAIKLNRDEVPVSATGITFPVAETTSITEAQAAGINVYPNPAAHNTIYVQSANDILFAEISDVTGKSVMQLHNLTNGTNAIDVSSISAGQYILHIQTEAHLVNQFIVIE